MKQYTALLRSKKTKDKYRRRKRFMMSDMVPVYRILCVLHLIFMSVAECIDQKPEPEMVNETRQNSMEEQVLSPAGESNHQPSEDARIVCDAVTRILAAELETINTTLKDSTYTLAIHGLSSPYAQKDLTFQTRHICRIVSN
ncbi:MAG: hypothetical protein KBG16_08580 [Methanospirillum sp.]|jgi:hypothetical protein|nr:hypothetical protein [Methanospirillum sp.]